MAPEVRAAGGLSIPQEPENLRNGLKTFLTMISLPVIISTDAENLLIMKLIPAPVIKNVRKE
jgi:hypothetical protein